MKKYGLYLVVSCMVLCGSVIASETPQDGLGRANKSSREDLSRSAELAREAKIALRSMYFEYPGPTGKIHSRDEKPREQMKPYPPFQYEFQ